MKRLHLTVSRTKTRDDGAYVQAIGVRIGYWPCLRAPFVSVNVGNRIVDLWWGLDSYLQTADRAWRWPR